MRDLFDAWQRDGRDEEDLAQLLNIVCQLTVAALDGGSLAARSTLNDDIAQLRALRPLPLAGANDFLGVLQTWLRGAPGQTNAINRIRAALPPNFAEALAAMEEILAR